METKININYIPSESKEVFGIFSISFIDYNGIVRSTRLKFNPKELWEFTKDSTSVAFDFLILAFIIYNVDRSINRIANSIDGWKRNIILENVPCLNIDKMRKSSSLFQNAVNFLTGDNWQINFHQIATYNYSPSENIKNYDHTQYDKVALFSGGLDSLIGFIDEVAKLDEHKKILLVSHMELGKERGDQDGILKYCKSKNIFNGKYSHILLNAGLKRNTWNTPTKTESTFRSRSLLFFAAGIYCAYSIDPHKPLIVPENGTISINVPLDKGRRSSCSTRTTHPTFIKRLQAALQSIGIENPIINPYSLMSKADMMINCSKDISKKEILKVLAPLSCSCAKRSHNSFWDKSGSEIHDNQISHCGMCLPCLYRRVALDAVDLDDANLFGTDVFHGIKYDLEKKNQKRNRDFNALLRFINERMDENYIRRELFINGVKEIDGLTGYVSMVLHSYEQVKDWITKNGTISIRKKAGIKC